jgi:CheY-like chemotaxis protein
LRDEFRLQQILNNLLSNAIKFTKQGEVKLLIQPLMQTESQIRLLFRVTDTGIGISKEQQKHLFEPFNQADPSITRTYGGTGLGLAISQGLLRALGGTPIQIESCLGQGSCFCFEVSFSFADESEFETIQTTRKSEFHPLSGIVLIAEDNPINQEILQEQLKQIGLSSMLAPDGKQAVALSEKYLFDAILMDVIMPVMDGYQASQRIRETNQEIPIIAITAGATVEDQEKAMQAGMTIHLAKPATIAQLHETLSAALNQNQPLQDPHPIHNRIQTKKPNLPQNCHEILGLFKPLVIRIENSEYIDDNEINRIELQLPKAIRDHCWPELKKAIVNFEFDQAKQALNELMQCCQNQFD